MPGRGLIGPASGLLRRYQQRAVERIDNAYQKRATSLTAKLAANKAEVVKMRLLTGEMPIAFRISGIQQIGFVIRLFQLRRSSHVPDNNAD
jgi:hypothetical protein